MITRELPRGILSTLCVVTLCLSTAACDDGDDGDSGAEAAADAGMGAGDNSDAAEATDDGTGTAGEDDGGTPATFADVQAIFGASGCVAAACHDAATASEGLDLETDPHSALVNGTSVPTGKPLVVAGDSAGSYLIEKLGPSPSAGFAMPTGTNGLDPADLAVVASWIDAGANP